jgi:hypothetical protein
MKCYVYISCKNQSILGKACLNSPIAILRLLPKYYNKGNGGETLHSLRYVRSRYGYLVLIETVPRGVGDTFTIRIW